MGGETDVTLGTNKICSICALFFLVTKTKLVRKFCHKVNNNDDNSNDDDDDDSQSNDEIAGKSSKWKPEKCSKDAYI